MILNFKLKNYRSYKGEVEFSMLADAARAKEQNYVEVPYFESSKKKFKILKTAVIYGANASGKSNVVRGLNEWIRYILNKPNLNQDVPIYEPFRFSSETEDKDSNFELTFIGPERCKYTYSISFNKKVVLKEKLEYFPNGKGTIVLNRRNAFNTELNASDKKVDDKAMVESIKFEGKNYNLFRNQLFLSSFASEVHPILTPIYLYFQDRFQDVNGPFSKKDEVSHLLNSNDNLKVRLSKLLGAADTKIKGFHIIDLSKVIENLQNNLGDSNSTPTIERFMEFTVHDYYEGDILKSTDRILPLSKESQGSQTLYTLGTMILNCLEEGKTLIYDELDTSLHPYVTKMLMMLFLSPKINKKNAQLIFTTHDVLLLDSSLLRKDQIWFAEKEDRGVSDFYSLQDFDNVREDIPFDKWYTAGKFGGVPHIAQIESVFED